jgi:hypothetical protein
MLAIPDERVDSSVSGAKVAALLVRTGVALGVHASGGLLDGFSPHCRGGQAPEQVSHLAKECRRDGSKGSPVECVL